MTTRKLLAIIIALVFCVSLCSCASDASENGGNENAKFIIVSSGYLSGSGVHQFVMYDPDTMVMYTYITNGRNGGLSVIYNADGTPKLYSPEN